MIRSKVAASTTLALLERVREMRAAGKEVASFAAGEPDFETPAVVVEAAIADLKAGDTKYVSTPGVPPLRAAIADDYRTRLGVKWCRPENTLVTIGAKQGIYLILAGHLEPGDEVLIPKPFWVSYPGVVKAAAGVPVLVETSEKNGFFPTPAQLDAVSTPRTRALIFSSPNNPTGKMISREALRQLVQWCQKKRVLMIFDELYERLILDGSEHVCPLSMVDERDAGPIVCINAFSKSMAMTGWRLGYVVSSEDNIKALAPLQGQMVTCAPGFIQAGAVAGFAEAHDFLAPVVDAYKRRLEIILSELEPLTSVKALRPSGAFYVFVDVSQVMRARQIATDVEFAERLLHDQNVVVVPGTSMGMGGWIRLSFATGDDEIKAGLHGLKKFCS